MCTSCSRRLAQSTVQEELPRLVPFLQRPNVMLGIDPEFSMKGGEKPGTKIGTMSASDVNFAINLLSGLVKQYNLPPKVLIVHQFTMDMLPDKDKIWNSSALDVVLVADGFGSPALKRNTYSMVLRQHPLAFSGFKLFYIQDTDLLQPAQVLALTPSPSVIIYQ